MFWTLLAIYYDRIAGNDMAVFICMGLFYIVAAGKFALRYAIKDKYIKSGYYMGIHSNYCHKMIGLLIVLNIGMAAAGSLYIFVKYLTCTGKILYMIIIGSGSH